MTEARRRYRLPVVPDEQVVKSRGMILAAAEVAYPGAAIVLGAGRCSEIPLVELARRFQRLVINDIEPLPSQELVGQAGLNASEAAKIDWQAADLTGLIDPLGLAWKQVLADETHAVNAAEAMLQAAGQTSPSPVRLGSTYDLVVASCVLSQLHNPALLLALRLFGQRFPDHAEWFKNLPETAAQFYKLARRIEAGFIDLLAAITGPKGSIFLSESVRMCSIEADGAGHWTTEGTLRMTRTTHLPDYLDGRFIVKYADRWNWIADSPQHAGQRGRLFDVQGLILSLTRTAAG